jgi:hypothetical protein
MNYKNVFLLAFLLPIFVTEAKNKQTTSKEEVATAQAIHDLGGAIESFAKILEKLSQQLEDGITITHRHCE